MKNRSHEHNLSSTSGEAELLAQFYFKNWNTGNTEEENNGYVVLI
jgi:hypothetical protein